MRAAAPHLSQPLPSLAPAPLPLLQEWLAVNTVGAVGSLARCIPSSQGAHPARACQGSAGARHL